MIKVILSEANKHNPNKNSDLRFSNLEIDGLETREAKPRVSKADPENFKSFETDPGRAVDRAIDKAKKNGTQQSQILFWTWTQKKKMG